MLSNALADATALEQSQTPSEPQTVLSLGPRVGTFLEEHNSSQSLSLESFTKLDISDRLSCSLNARSAISWPLRNLDLSHLKSLCINGDEISPAGIVNTLNNAFTDGSFVNLSKLSFKRIGYVTPLTLINVPLLESIHIEYRGPFLGGFLPLALTDNLRLKSFTYKGTLDMLTPFLAQIEGLECLIITAFEPVYNADEYILDLVSAIVANGETVRVLKFKADIHLLGEERRSQWEAEFVKKIRLCDKLVDLSLPFVEKPMSYFRDLITSFIFPHLSGLTIYTGFESFFNWSSSHARGLFSASTQMESVLFKGPRLFPEKPSLPPRSEPFRYRLRDYGWHRRCFVRN